MTSRDSDAVFVETNTAAQYGSICTKIKIVLCLIHLLEMVLQYEGSKMCILMNLCVKKNSKLLISNFDYIRLQFFTNQITLARPMNSKHFSALTFSLYT